MKIWQFSTFEEACNYIENTLGISYTDNPTGWSDALKELTSGCKNVKLVNDTTGEVSWQWVSENTADMFAKNGEWHYVSDPDYVTGQTTSTGTKYSGGMKSAPTAKSVVTNSQTQTAVLEEEAVGVKDVGLTAPAPAINIITGILQCYGLVQTGIAIANSQVFKDMINYAFGDGDPGHAILTPDDPLYKVVEFLGKYTVNTIMDLTTDGELCVNIPESIARRMYEFLSNHMVQTLQPGVTVDDAIFNNINTYYNFISRTFDITSPDQTLERYFSTTNPSTQFMFPMVEISDDLLRNFMTDFSEQVIGAGFSLSTGVATALIASMAGVIAFIQEQSVGASDDATYIDVVALLDRGSTPPPKTTPVSLSEFTIGIEMRAIEDLDTEDIEGVDYLKTDLNVNTSYVPTPALSTGAYTVGDNVKYLKRGHEGTAPVDYAYRVHTTRKTGGSHRLWRSTITYPANEQVKSYSSSTSSSTNLYPSVNGYNWSAGSTIYQDGDTYVSGIPARGMMCNYSNLGYKGFGESYGPDDYLVTAGIKTKVVDGNAEKNPDPTKTMEEQYPETATKKQVAGPNKNASTGEVTNNITNYIPGAVPYGSEIAQQIINSGTDSSVDPSAYIDNRPQEDKRKGKANTNDPIDGINEALDDAVDEYNDSDEDIDHYPEPIPKNEPNPQYPTDPPNVPGGDTPEPPTPGTMEGVEASGMVSVYNPTKAQIVSFSGWLWSPAFIDNLLKLFQNPMDGIIALHILYATPHTSGNENIRVGYLDSGVSSKVVDQQFIEVDCGHVKIPEYYGDAIDYEPYVQIHVYLPFVGVVSLKPNDVIGKDLYIKYGVDVLTGTCLAMLTAKDKLSEILLYTFSGNCAVQVPVSGGNYAQVISGLATMAIGVGAGVATGNPIAAVGGVAAGVMSSHLDVSHSGSIGANAGAMGPRKPHVIITRKSAYDAGNYNQFYGFPANKTVTLGSCKGYTRIKSVHIESIFNATDNEKTEIEALLKQGVIIN